MNEDREIAYSEFDGRWDAIMDEMTQLIFDVETWNVMYDDDLPIAISEVMRFSDRQSAVMRDGMWYKDELTRTS